MIRQLLTESVLLAGLGGGWRLAHTLALVPRGGGVQLLYAQKLTGPIAILVGNEGAGLSAETLQAASRRVTIPMPGNVESLNAAAAGAICLFEMVRQRVSSKHS